MSLALSATSWFVADPSGLWKVPVVALGILLAVTATVRIVGIRSLSKMMSFDFAVTVSLGSVLASIATLSTSLITGAVAVGSLLAAQALLTWTRRRYGWAQASLDNVPVMLMDGPEILDRNLRAVRMTHADVYAQLRLAGVASVADVGAVVLEITGDVSVLTSVEIDDELLTGVRRRVDT